ncbi:MAG: PEGA domain-containing protein [bacterium]|nr:PEGA domain-containing protein [bacterium]
MLGVEEYKTVTCYSLDIDSSPPGAAVHLNGEHIGNTPIGWSGEKEATSLVIKKSGYEDKEVMVDDLDWAVKEAAPPYQWPEELEKSDERYDGEKVRYKIYETSLSVILEKVD